MNGQRGSYGSGAAQGFDSLISIRANQSRNSNCPELTQVRGSTRRLTPGEWIRISGFYAAAFCLLACLAPARSQTTNDAFGALPEISLAARPAETITVAGQRSALLGHESGRFEAWAWPLKILHDFHLSFRVGSELLPGDLLVRSITVRPESTTLVYAGDTFSIQETLLVPIDQPAALIQLKIETTQPLEIIAAFQPDLQLEWPGAVGGADTDWNPRLHAYVMSEAQQRFEAVVGSPTAAEYTEQYPFGYAGPRETAFSLGMSPQGSDSKIIVMTGALGQPREAEQRFLQLSSQFDETLANARQYYADYLKDRVQVSLPDPMLQQALVWSELSMIQSLVNNPYLGRGLIAGYNTSGDDERPGFAWFFGRDSMWTALALDDVGDLRTAREALEFMAKYQRADGKIPHEISQAASFVPWFTATPFAWAAADATPLFIIAMRDYVQRSGDVQFMRDHWNGLWKAYQFITTTYGPDGLAQNLNVGHGWVEAGPLVPMRAELYQSGLGIEAVRSLASLAGLLHKEDVQQELSAEFENKRPTLNQAFWMPEQRVYAIGRDLDDRPIDIPSVLSTVPMWFGLLDTDKAEPMIDRIEQPDFQTDWGMRIISARDAKYDPGGYHAGSVWPLFTGWASVGAYRYHRAFAGFSGLYANAQLTWSGELGHVPEVLSGNYFQQLSGTTPDQTWSAAMVASPLLRGLFGLQANALTHTLIFAPHVPADWASFSIGNIRVGAAALDLRWVKTTEAIRLDVTRHGTDTCELDFSPAISLGAKVRRVLVNSRPVPFHIEANTVDQHVMVHVATASSTETIIIQLAGNFGVSESGFSLPLAGGKSEHAAVIEERWSAQRDVLYLEVDGAAGAEGDLNAWDPAEIVSVEGAQLLPPDQNSVRIHYQMPTGHPGADAHLEIAIHLRRRNASR